MVLTSALDSTETGEIMGKWYRKRGAYGNRGSISRAASDEDERPIAALAHARKDGIGDIYGPKEVRLHFFHNTLGAKNLIVNTL
jgi:hypothetical protein